MKHEKKILTPDERKKLGFSFIELSDGFTKYELKGPENGDLVVMVPGYSMADFLFDHNYDYFVEKGFRVLRYDTYGRGFSDRPNVVNDENLFEKQLYELLNKLNPTKKPFNLVGLSMGGAISVVFADRHPELIKRLILIDPAGMPNKMPGASKLLTLPFIGKFFFYLIGHNILLKQWQRSFAYPKKFLEFRDKMEAQMVYKGYLDSLYSTLMNMPLYGLEKVFENLGRHSFPKYLFWGDRDQVVPIQARPKIQAAIPEIEYYEFKDCGHMPNYERSTEFNPILLSILRDTKNKNNEL